MFFFVILFASSLLIDDAVQSGAHEPRFNKFAMARNEQKRSDETCKLYCHCPDGPALRGVDEEEDFSGNAQSLGKPGYSKRTEKTASTLDAIYYDYPSPLIRRIHV